MRRRKKYKRSPALDKDILYKKFVVPGLMNIREGVAARPGLRLFEDCGFMSRCFS